jgi:hypothetical protein
MPNYAADLQPTTDDQGDGSLDADLPRRYSPDE